MIQISGSVFRNHRGDRLGGCGMIDFKKGLVNRGNWYALQGVFLGE